MPFYAQHFGAVEVNSSFYRLPSPSTLQDWRHAVPDGFRFALKANRYLTQTKRLRDGAEPIARMMAALRHLGPALGPILYQLPPSLGRDDGLLADFLALLPNDTIHVFEFRHASWYTDAVFAMLAAHEASLCVHDMPGASTPRIATGKVAYLRFHGPAGGYRGRYPAQTLHDAALWLEDQAHLERSAWAFFNNDIGGDAVRDALRLRRLIAESPTLLPGEAAAPASEKKL